MRARAVLVLLLVLAGLAGCASVPESSPVQVLRRVGDGDAPVLPPGPVDGSNALDLVRGFVYASGSSPDRHGAARRFLAPEAADWDDGTGVTVLTEQFDTVYPTSVDPESGMRTVRIRGTALGRLTPGGWFEASQAPVQIDVNVVRRDGQWRIARLPGGVLVRMSDFRVNYRTVKTWFVDPVRRVAVPDLRYLPGSPARAQAARAMELLLAGPSTALQGAASTMFVTNAQLRSNVAASPDGALIVDLTQLGDLDEAGRRLLAAQVVLSLAEVSVGRVRLLADGAPLLPDRPDLTRDDVASLIAEPAPTTVPALVVYNGRVHQLNGGQLDTALPGPIGNGEVTVQSAASSPDGRRVAVVAADGSRRRLLLGGAEGAAVPVGLEAGTMSRPSWTASGSEVWTVLDATTVSRVVLDTDGNARVAPVNARELTGMGPIQDLRLSRDGLRVAAVVRGGLYTAALARSPDGDVTIRNVRSLRPSDLGEVVAVDWRAAETIVAVSRRMDGPVSQVSVDGLTWDLLPGSNLTPPLRAVAAAPNRPVLVTDQSGVWSFAGGDLESWRQLVGGVPDAVPLYPG
ncbi:MAG TPA: LpqB family beta-propeller domain-containing protein [Pseudonocardia sp.]|nr:LpqB family beta-propeller domain-containing protein [Pseudonocardia sp.]